MGFAIIAAWKEYLDLLSSSSISSEQWSIRRVDLMVELLYKMAHVLNYDFDKTHIKNSFYSSMAHGVTEEEQTALRRGLLDVLEGKKHIPISLSEFKSYKK